MGKVQRRKDTGGSVSSELDAAIKELVEKELGFTITSTKRSENNSSPGSRHITHDAMDIGVKNTDDHSMLKFFFGEDFDPTDKSNMGKIKMTPEGLAFCKKHNIRIIDERKAGGGAHFHIEVMTEDRADIVAESEDEATYHSNGRKIIISDKEAYEYGIEVKAGKHTYVKNDYNKTEDYQTNIKDGENVDLKKMTEGGGSTGEVNYVVSNNTHEVVLDTYTEERGSNVYQSIKDQLETQGYEVITKKVTPDGELYQDVIVVKNEEEANKAKEYINNKVTYDGSNRVFTREIPETTTPEVIEEETIEPEEEGPRIFKNDEEVLDALASGELSSNDTIRIEYDGTDEGKAEGDIYEGKVKFGADSEGENEFVEYTEGEYNDSEGNPIDISSGRLPWEGSEEDGEEVTEVTESDEVDIDEPIIEETPIVEETTENAPEGAETAPKFTSAKEIKEAFDNGEIKEGDVISLNGEYGQISVENEKPSITPWDKDDKEFDGGEGGNISIDMLIDDEETYQEKQEDTEPPTEEVVESEDSVIEKPNRNDYPLNPNLPSRGSINPETKGKTYNEALKEYEDSLEIKSEEIPESEERNAMQEFIDAGYSEEDARILMDIYDEQPDQELKNEILDNKEVRDRELNLRKEQSIETETTPEVDTDTEEPIIEETPVVEETAEVEQTLEDTLRDKFTKQTIEDSGYTDESELTEEDKEWIEYDVENSLEEINTYGPATQRMINQNPELAEKYAGIPIEDIVLSDDFEGDFEGRYDVHEEILDEERESNRLETGFTETNEERETRESGDIEVVAPEEDIEVEASEEDIEVQETEEDVDRYGKTEGEVYGELFNATDEDLDKLKLLKQDKNFITKNKVTNDKILKAANGDVVASGKITENAFYDTIPSRMQTEYTEVIAVSYTHLTLPTKRIV